ncbi:MurR/RpiR family transcriptional regulator [Salinisphaera japonica]|uniref:Iron-sulfur cluster assembly protein HesB n=1 Tax=Salinisphaera japonica YTM-1 TaxID=1209778 RepID=A0A423PE79_9GAMM|nr:MurR/RpiR family transcriptional regulator [Salinisphaera japonica]ROO23823.1 iron-sulfur cluster assembly protein HesB [Salinisphaera japonica YTM-1]
METQAPETPGELQRRILADYKNLSKRLQQIAQFAVDHPNDMALETTATIAERAGVQPSAIIRFAKAFGYSGFSELQRVYQTRLAESASSYSERLRRLRRDEENATESVTPQGVLRQFCQANRISLEHLAADIAPATLERAAQCLAGAQRIYLCGQRRSFPVVAYMAYALGQIDADAVLLDGLGGMLGQQAVRMNAADVLFAVSFHPYAEETADVIRRADEHNVPIVVLTDSPLSPVAAHATVCLEIHDAELHNFRSLTASMCLAQALTVSVGLALGRGDAESDNG